MDSGTDLHQGRYVLFPDILGFTELVESRGAEEVYETINKALAAFGRWEELNRLFRTIYFADTFIFYQDPKGYGDWNALKFPNDILGSSFSVNKPPRMQQQATSQAKSPPSTTPRLLFSSRCLATNCTSGVLELARPPTPNARYVTNRVPMPPTPH